MKTLYLSLIALALIASGVIAYVVLKPSETDLLFEQCKTKILSQLKAPATAVFGEYQHTPKILLEFPVNGKEVSTEKFTVTVDAQNAFGALIRGQWYCSLFYDDTDKLLEFGAHKKE